MRVERIITVFAVYFLGALCVASCAQSTSETVVVETETASASSFGGDPFEGAVTATAPPPYGTLGGASKDPDDDGFTGWTSSDPNGTGSAMLGLTEADCNRQHIECFRNCWHSTPPWPITKGTAGHYKYCTSKCLAEYMACLAAAGVLRAFGSLQQAAEWLKQNPGVAVGTVVLVAGVAYVVSTGGAGALILLPLAG